MQRILIVDDNEDIREVLGTYVAKEGFEPVVAKDGFEALDLFKKANPAVVLLDVMTVSYTHLTLPTTERG